MIRVLFPQRLVTAVLDEWGDFKSVYSMNETGALPSSHLVMIIRAVPVLLPLCTATR